jgi:hypothetical protein
MVRRYCKNTRGEGRGRSEQTLLFKHALHRQMMKKVLPEKGKSKKIMSEEIFVA